ncbi:MAG: hypothetical protein U0223_11665 [Nitrospira sp.]|nr:hypothetical protein [Nitrospira sp.]
MTQQQERDIAVDFWKVFSSDAGKAFAQEIIKLILEHEAPNRKRNRKQTAFENYKKLAHALSANLVYLHELQRETLQTRRGLYVSRSKRVLAKKRPKHTSAPDFVNKQVIPLLDTMAATDLIHQIIPVTHGRIQNPFRKTRQYGDSTIIHPTGRFLKFMSEHGVKGLEHVRRDAQGEEIVLLKSKRADGDLSETSAEVDYPDNETADHYRTILRQIQQRLDVAPIRIINGGWPSAKTGLLIDVRMRRLRRVFTRERWDSCGRYYGAWWIPLSKAERLSRILMEGRYVAELDFSSMMVRLAYGLAKAQPRDGDQYAVPGFAKSRDCIKVLMSALLFDQPGYNRKKLPPDALEGLHKDEVRPATEIIQALKEYHKPLLPLCGAGVGHDLFFQESQIMTMILLRLNTLGITGLPVHDAIYVPTHRVQETKAIMEQVFREEVGMEGVVRVTMPNPTQVAA